MRSGVPVVLSSASSASREEIPVTPIVAGDATDRRVARLRAALERLAFRPQHKGAYIRCTGCLGTWYPDERPRHREFMHRCYIREALE